MGILNHDSYWRVADQDFARSETIQRVIPISWRVAHQILVGGFPNIHGLEIDQPTMVGYLTIHGGESGIVRDLTEVQKAAY